MPKPTRPERRAYALLVEHGITRPPIPIDDLARKLGARLSFEAFSSNISGLLYRDGLNVTMAINSSHATTRQRFTIAHEIGHLLLHEGPMFVDKAMRIDRRDDNAALGTAPEEIEANGFAAALLMPAHMVIGMLTQLSRANATADEIIAALAHGFSVSSQAMEYRLVNLGLLEPH